MKKTSLFFAFTIILFMFSCQTETKPLENENTHFEGKSKFYKETIFTFGGEFLGFTLGEEQKTASKKLPKEKRSLQEDNYQLYKFTGSYSDTEYQLYFKDGKLEEINFDTYIKDAQGNNDKDGALTLFNELKKELLKTFGNKFMESSDEANEILYWSKDKKNIQLIHEFDKAAVHAYLDITETN